MWNYVRVGPRTDGCMMTKKLIKRWGRTLGAATVGARRPGAVTVEARGLSGGFEVGGWNGPSLVQPG